MVEKKTLTIPFRSSPLPRRPGSYRGRIKRTITDTSTGKSTSSYQYFGGTTPADWGPDGQIVNDPFRPSPAAVAREQAAAIEKKFLQTTGKKIEQLSDLERKELQQLKKGITPTVGGIPKYPSVSPELGLVKGVSSRTQSVLEKEYPEYSELVAESNELNEEIRREVQKLEALRASVSSPAGVARYNKAVKALEKKVDAAEKLFQKASREQEKFERLAFAQQKEFYKKEGIYSGIKKVYGREPRTLEELQEAGKAYERSPIAFATPLSVPSPAEQKRALIEKDLATPSALQAVQREPLTFSKLASLRAKKEGLEVLEGIGIASELAGREVLETTPRFLGFQAPETRKAVLDRKVKAFEKQVKSVEKEREKVLRAKLKGTLTDKQVSEFNASAENLRKQAREINSEVSIFESSILPDPLATAERAIGAGIIFAPLGGLFASASGGSAAFGVGTELVSVAGGSVLSETASGVERVYQPISKTTGVPPEITEPAAGLAGFLGGSYVIGRGITGTAARSRAIARGKRGMGIQARVGEDITASTTGSATILDVKQPLLGERTYLIGTGGRARAGMLDLPVLEPSVRKLASRTSLKAKGIKILEEGGEITIFEPSQAPGIGKEMGLKVLEGERTGFISKLGETPSRTFKTKITGISELDFLKKTGFGKIEGAEIQGLRAKGVISSFEEGIAARKSLTGVKSEKTGRVFSTGDFETNLLQAGRGSKFTSIGKTKTRQDIQATGKAPEISLELSTDFKVFGELGEPKPSRGAVKVGKTVFGEQAQKTILDSAEKTRETGAIGKALSDELGKEIAKVKSARLKTQKASTGLGFTGFAGARVRLKAGEKTKLFDFAKAKSKTKGFQGILSKSALGESLLFSEKTLEKTKTGTIASAFAETALFPRQTASSEPVQATETALLPVLSTATASKTGFAELPGISTGVFSLPAIDSPPVVNFPGLPLPVLKPRASEEKPLPRGKELGYNTFLKRKGRFKKVSDKPLTKRQATGLGAFLADNTSAATFEVRKTKKPVKKKITPFTNLGKFRKPIRKGKSILQSNKWVEKNRYRIDTPGERKQITAKGLKALKKRFFASQRKQKPLFSFSRKKKKTTLFSKPKTKSKQKSVFSKIRLFENKKNKKGGLFA